MTVSRPTLRVRDGRPPLQGTEAALYRIRVVLTTRPGDIPWRPEFGCSLDTFVGQPANSRLLNDAEWRIEEALARWVPDLKVIRCTAAADPIDAELARRVRATNGGDRQVLNLLSLGTDAVLRVTLDVQLGDETVRFDVGLAP